MATFQSVEEKLKSMAQRLAPSSLEKKRVLHLIGQRLLAYASKIIRVKHIKKTGYLRENVGYKFIDNDSILFGSFNTPYAAVHEFGFKGTVKVSAHSRKTKTGSSEVRSHQRKMSIKKRPFLRPPVNENTKYIIDQLRTLVKS